MKIINNLGCEVPGTNTYYLNLEQFSDNSCSEVLIYGYNTLFDTSFDKIKNYKRKIYFNVTMPTEFASNQNISLDDKFDEVYTICPYSVDWLNHIKLTDKYKHVWYPFNLDYTPKKQQKIYDVCYHGGLHGEKYVKLLNVLKNFNYRYMTMSNGINLLTRQYLPYVTDIDLSYQDKINRISQCKISVCYNNLPLNNEHIQQIKTKQQWESNIAFNSLHQKICPQLKCRFIEACFAKTLNLVEKDNWNIIEKFYVPDKHFIYFDKQECLKTKIENILQNFNNFADIINNAYSHSYNNYTCKNLINHIRQ